MIQKHHFRVKVVLLRHVQEVQEHCEYYEAGETSRRRKEDDDFFFLSDFDFATLKQYQEVKARGLHVKSVFMNQKREYLHTKSKAKFRLGTFTVSQISNQVS